MQEWLVFSTKHEGFGAADRERGRGRPGEDRGMHGELVVAIVIVVGVEVAALGLWLGWRAICRWGSRMFHSM